MFTPSQHDVRTFFCEAWRKQCAGEPLSPMDTLAAEWIARHPEYHAELSDLEAALTAVYTVEDGQKGRTNPFLHLSMHLSISEQCSIDQPRGIRQAVELLHRRRGSLHAAHHEAMECLGRMMLESQRAGRPPDGDAYVACVQRRATAD